ncbi:MAG: (2Fe-2S)-binding protein [Planctomycetes bacterium]|nr:(2Fe-2S)-binding protein [Planctomycetota bacterium]
MEEINFTIDDQSITCEKDEMLLDVALANGFEIPHLCYHQAEPPYGSCRLCLVEITKRGSSWVEASCTYPVRDNGIEVKTDTEDVRRFRKMNMELLLAQCPNSEEVQEMARDMGVEGGRLPPDGQNECLLCGLCVNVCRDLIGIGGINFVGRGADRRVTTPYDEPSKECIGCGACAEICPSGYIQIHDEDGVRRIEPFGIECELVKCPECGRGYVPKKQLEYVKDELGEEKSELLRGCPVCKGQRRAEELKKIYDILESE